MRCVQVSSSDCGTKPLYLKVAIMLRKYGEVKIFVKDDNTSKLHSRLNKEQVEFGECLLQRSLESFVFLSSVLKRKS